MIISFKSLYFYTAKRPIFLQDVSQKMYDFRSFSTIKKLEQIDLHYRRQAYRSALLLSYVPFFFTAGYEAAVS